uniref:Uncharacterized protein n=1 Tax=Arundo donax TaxID=35708 RepID=A0A0A9A0R3_ARUDO
MTTQAFLLLGVTGPCLCLPYRCLQTSLDYLGQETVSIFGAWMIILFSVGCLLFNVIPTL